MRKKCFVTLFIPFVLLTSCGDSSKNSGSVQIETQTVSASKLKVNGKTTDFSFEDAELNGWCRIYSDDYKEHYDYKGLINTDYVSPQYLSEILTNAAKGKKSDSYAPISERASVTASSDGEKIRIAAGYATVYGYDELDNATESEEPAFYITCNGKTAIYLSTESEIQSFCDTVYQAVVGDKTIPEPDSSDVKKSDLILIDYYSNYAEEPVLEGSVIDRYGNIYNFDLSDMDVSEEYSERYETDTFTYDEALIDAVFNNCCLNSEPDGKISEEIMSELETLCSKVPMNGNYTKESVGCDIGDYSLCAVQNKGTVLVTIRSTGDNNVMLQSSYADNICEIYDRLK